MISIPLDVTNSLLFKRKRNYSNSNTRFQWERDLLRLGGIPPGTAWDRLGPPKRLCEADLRSEFLTKNF